MMVKYSHDLQRELEALKRKADDVFRRRTRIPAAEGEASRAASGRVGGDGEESSNRMRGTSTGQRLRPRGPLTELVPGESVTHGGEEFYRVLVNADEVWEDTGQFYGEYLDALASPFAADPGDLDALGVLQETPPGAVCYLDLETTGLSSVPLFLVGLMYATESTLVIDQLFARDYSEESTVLSFAKEIVGGFEVLVTFNGMRFDLPFLMERMIYNGIEFTPPRVHVDLLPLARKVVKGRTPNHRLQTLETFLCKRKRIDDIPGSEIPDVYHEFIRSHDAGDVAGVFHHNRLDLLTMLQLVTIFLSGR